ncbi:MAG: methyltransferase domain-containing protein [Nitrospirae bacterium]|nr:MAG: methyltransferase domain-containing protein [Nitrospirota bacterium]
MPIWPSCTKMTDYAYLARDLETLADLQNYHEWIFDETLPFLGTCVAEIGAGLGTITELLVRKHLKGDPGTKLEVFEPAGNLYERLQEKLRSQFPGLIQAGRLKTTKGSLQLSPQRFDTIVLINVLEHIQQDQEFIRVVYRSLVPGGTFIVFVPALPWLYSAFDKAVGHHRRYEKNRLRWLLQAEGFEVIKAKYMDLGGVLPWYMVNVLGKSTAINRRLARMYDRWCVPFTRWVEDQCGAVIGKNILMVGRKSEGISV